MPLPRQNEKKFHTELIDTCRAAGGYGRKIQRMFIKGMPDVDLKYPCLAMRHVEVKHLVFAKMPTEIQVETTSLQRIEIRKMRAAGMVAGWCAFVTVGRNHYYICSMGQIYAKTVITPERLMLWDKKENTLLTILQSL